MASSDLLALTVWYLLALPASLLLHEHGHLLAGLLMGLRDGAVGLGDPATPLVKTVRAGTLTYRLHSPRTWLTYAYYLFVPDEDGPSRWKSMSLAAAGPGANLGAALLCGIWLLDSGTGTLPALAHPALAVGAVNLWVGLYNLLPLSLGGAETDGMVIMRLLQD